VHAASHIGGALAAYADLGLIKTAKDCFFCAASKGAVTPNMTLMRGPPPTGKGSFKQDTAHFWLEDKKGKVTDPTAYQYPQGYDYSKGKPVNLMANLDAVIDDPLFKTLSKTHQRKIKKLWKRHGEVKTANLATVLAVLGAGAGAGVGRRLARADKKTMGTLVGAAVGAGAGAASTPVLRMPIAHGMASLMELSDNPFLHAEARNLRQSGSLSEEAHHEGPSEEAKQKLRAAARKIRERLEAAGLDPSKARVAISGTGGTGKSTLAKEIARSMGLKYQGLE
jgi:hypothetical protein